jgi:hypothetical protein
MCCIGEAHAIEPVPLPVLIAHLFVYLYCLPGRRPGHGWTTAEGRRILHSCDEKKHYEFIDPYESEAGFCTNEVSPQALRSVREKGNPTGLFARIVDPIKPLLGLRTERSWSSLKVRASPTVFEHSAGRGIVPG